MSNIDMSKMGVFNVPLDLIRDHESIDEFVKFMSGFLVLRAEYHYGVQMMEYLCVHDVFASVPKHTLTPMYLLLFDIVEEVEGINMMKVTRIKNFRIGEARE